jgi:hypothetical protein
MNFITVESKLLRDVAIFRSLEYCSRKKVILHFIIDRHNSYKESYYRRKGA